ncbi:MAG: hypothetical protein K6V36_15225 [Anaerolineae bacterium]|nr:hypothetical protein [Anaerolineae bacterium]
MRGATLCAAHAGRMRRQTLPRGLTSVPEPELAKRHLPTLESEISLLAARRDEVDHWLKQRMDECETGEVLRYLTVLAQVGKSLALMLAQRAAAGGAAEIEGFFEAVAERVREIAGPGAEESDGPAGGGP